MKNLKVRNILINKIYGIRYLFSRINIVSLQLITCYRNLQLIATWESQKSNCFEHLFDMNVIKVRLLDRQHGNTH